MVCTIYSALECRYFRQKLTHLGECSVYREDKPMAFHISQAFEVTQRHTSRVPVVMKLATFNKFLHTVVHLPCLPQLLHNMSRLVSVAFLGGCLAGVPTAFVLFSGMALHSLLCWRNKQRTNYSSPPPSNLRNCPHALRMKGALLYYTFCSTHLLAN